MHEKKNVSDQVLTFYETRLRVAFSHYFSIVYYVVHLEQIPD